MVKLNKIYTRTGDDGTTGLGNGERRAKFDLRVEAFGTIDEANACVGLARLHTGESCLELDTMLSRIQNDLFDLGADLSTPDDGVDLDYEPLRIIEAQVLRVEREIDQLNAGLSPLRSFVLPGGTPASAALHLARTVSRRAERIMVELSQTTGERVTKEALQYINRVSDFLFVAARVVNDNGARDVLWVPGQNR
ncbi:cob(I)yrinic acid a,c-diamide adenosyltransferase [Phyllobacterium salinisoli]|uniref:Corrinoid adenosyltransferase n=1 Tax=Phyllobacterium salinisoli TaxID=1899321 RepID=A0A368K1V1_9HYPH|nr:cob(I)yrinic acid a,c-diamide adenosyltransferase [Phyllobacterium salinisoli]RCS22453.1 cob(I)yrinic acid a,c-diamide adenosyltransferase [Phyllobacterium salinisoli]